MAVKIRLRRMGQKKAPFYRIVVADSRSQETEDASKRSEHMIRTLNQVVSLSMRKQLRSGLTMEHSQQK